MAGIKVSYKDLKKDDNGQLATIFGGKSIISKNTGFETIEVEKITEDPKGDFVNLFPFNEDSARSIAESMLNKGYDKTQVIHVAKILEEPETVNNPIRIDGAHRCWAAKEAGIEKIPVYIHTFETRVEALIYAYELQLNRRNLEAYEKLDAMQKLDQLKNPGRKKDDDTESSGKSAEEMAKLMGVSTRQAERMRNIINNGDEDTIEAVKKGEKSISAADKEINQKKKKEKQDSLDEEDLSDALDDNTGNPRGLNFNHSDGIERPTNKLSPEEDSERTRERKQAYLQGLSEGFYKALVYACSEIAKGRDPKDVYTDDRVSDLSPSVIEKFELPEDAEDIVGRW